MLRFINRLSDYLFAATRLMTVVDSEVPTVLHISSTILCSTPTTPLLLPLVPCVVFLVPCVVPLLSCVAPPLPPFCYP